MQVIGINTKHIAQIKIFYLVEVGLLIVGAGVIEFEFLVRKFQINPICSKAFAGRDPLKNCYQ